MTLSFGNTGILRLDPAERKSDNAYRAQLYNETLSIGGADTQ